MKSRLFVTLFMLLSIASCETDCSPGFTFFGLVGFTNPEAESMIIRKLEKGNHAVIDTSLITHIQLVRSNDTLRFGAYSTRFQIESGYDYELVFPLIPKTVLVTNLQEDRSRNSAGCNKKQCVNAITGATVDGNEIPITPYDLLYISQ